MKIFALERQPRLEFLFEMIRLNVDGYRSLLAVLTRFVIHESWPLPPKKERKKKRKGKNWWSKACRGLEFRFWGFINGEEGKFIPPLFRSRRSSGRSNFHTVSFPRKQNSSHSNV